MEKIKYDIGLIGFIALFERITKAKVKDAIASDRLTFIVEQNEMGKAIGKRGANARLVEQKLNRKIKIVEFNPDPVEFIKNFVFPLQVEQVAREGSVITISGRDKKTKGMLIGRNSQNIKNLLKVVRRYFDSISEVKVS